MELHEIVEQMNGKLDGAIASKAPISEVKRLREQIEELKQQDAEIHAQLDALETKTLDRSYIGGGSGSYDPNWLGEYLKADSRLQDFIKHGRGNVALTFEGKDYENLVMSQRMAQKTLVDSASLGSAVSGVLGIQRTPGVVAEARQELRLRNLLSALPTDQPQVDYIKVSSPPVIASLQIEGLDKLENGVTFTTATAPIKTIATWCPITKQAAQDSSEIMRYIQIALPYYVNLREETEFLAGAGGSVEINGLITQAAALQTALALPSYNKSDLLDAAAQQIETATEIAPDFCILHPTDYHQIIRTKDANRNYVFNGGSVALDPFWGLTPIRTTKIPVGTFLVGSSNPNAVLIRDRAAMQILLSDSHSDYFVKNKIAILAEKRSGLCVFRPNCYVTGSFTASP